MRIVVFVFLLGLMLPAFAVTKCELKGKVLYKNGTCPEHSSTKYLVKDKFVAEKYLQKNQQKRDAISKKAYNDMNTPIKSPEENAESLAEKQQLKPEKMKMSNETAHFQLQKVENGNDKEDEIMSPKVKDGVNDELSEMEKKLGQDNKELQQLQQE